MGRGMVPGPQLPISRPAAGRPARGPLPLRVIQSVLTVH